jgi:serine/threonine-protein kinase
MHLPDDATICASLPKVKNLVPLTQAGQKMVYRATHDDHGPVVLKLFLSDTGNERTRREIDVITGHCFPNVPAIFASGVIAHSGGDTTYLIEQYIDGETLRDVLVRKGKLPLERVLVLLEWLLSLAVAFEVAHLVHRDIKPENIMIDNQGQFWLLDFGIARHLDKESITATAAVWGPSSAGYAPPEQFRNIKHDLDSRADLFAIGVVAHEALTGTHPFRTGAQDHLDIYRRTLTIDAPPLTLSGDTQKQLAGFIATLMAKHPSRRPKTAQQAKDWFVALLPTIQGGSQLGSS